MQLGAMVKERLAQRFELRQEDIGADAKQAKKGFHFETEVYTVEGVGNLCVLRMKALFGLMKMETVVLAPAQKDLPLINWDWVGAFGSDTLIVEIYDVQLTPCPQEAWDSFAAIRDGDADLPEYVSGAHWYDALLSPCSYHKKGKGLAERLNSAAQRYTDAYIALLTQTPDCDAEKKGEKVRGFASALLQNGGPAVDQVKKLFGEEYASRLVLGHMYGCR